jgi:hypothetical protein
MKRLLTSSARTFNGRGVEMLKRFKWQAALSVALFAASLRFHPDSPLWLIWPLLGVTYNKIQQFTEDLSEKVHNLQSDALTVALTTNANAPVATNSVLANLTQIAYTNLSSRVLTVSTSAQSGGTYKLVIADLVLTASGAVATFRWVVIYNDTPTSPADPLICYFDYGSDVTLATGETFTLDFDGTNGLLQIA